MDIKSVLDERVIDLNMTAKNKKEAIEHLAGKLKDAYSVCVPQKNEMKRMWILLPDILEN